MIEDGKVVIVRCMNKGAWFQGGVAAFLAAFDEDIAVVAFGDSRRSMLKTDRRTRSKH